MRRILIIGIVIVLVALVGARYVGLPPTANGAATRLSSSGTIEADSVRITTQVGGRIESLSVDEGDEVKSGQVVAQLDPTLQRADLKKAQAALAAAQAQLAQVKAGARAEDIHKAETAVQLATVTRDGARVAWEDAKTARDNPQDLDLKIASTQMQIAVAEQKLAQAEANKDAAQAENDSWARTASLVSKTRTICVPTPTGPRCQDFSAGSDVIQSVSFQWNLSSQKLASAFDAMGIARASLESAKANLAQLQAQRDNPLAANAQVDAARAQYELAEAALTESQATLALAQAGAVPEQIQAAEAGVKQAEAAMQTIQTQLDKMTLRAPLNGYVIARGAQQGEMALPGMSLLTCANLDEVRLRLYIPETQIARVKVGQPVAVNVDSFPRRTFDGRITFISPQAEFTPRNTQTQDERAQLVFAITVTIANGDHALKPGMPADATVVED